MRPATKTEARRAQREKKRVADIEALNKDLNLPSNSKISERKDRRVQKNNVQNNTSTNVPITRKFISDKSKEADIETPKKTSSKNITRSSQLTIPLEKAVDPILKKPRKQKTAVKTVMEEKTEEEDA